MPSTDPLWYCHECHAEMRPLFVPDAHCASCNGTFVEQIDPTDDPRGEPRLGDFPAGVDGIDPIFRLFQAMGLGRPQGPGGTEGANSGFGSSQRTQGESINRSDPPSREPRIRGGMYTFELRSNNNGGTRRLVIGSPGSLRRNNSGSSDSPADGQRRDPFDNPFLIQQYLMSMLGMPSTMTSGPMEGGRMGDYVFSQDALEQIMNQLMENGHKPVPLPEKDIGELPRGVLADDSPLLGQDCQVCQDTFEAPKEGDEPKEPGMLTTVTLPCKHAFHEDCIVPWLKQSGTCPVCRHALIAQPAPQGPPGSSGPGGGSSSSSPDGSRGGGPGGPGGLFNFLSGFPRHPSTDGASGGGGGGEGNNSRTGTPGGASNRGGSVPGAWQDFD